MANEEKTPEQLRDDVEQARAQLASTLSELGQAATPANIARMAGQRVVRVFVDDNGSIRADRVAIAAAVVIGVVGLKLLSRRRRG